MHALDKDARSVMFYVVDGEGQVVPHGRATVVFNERTTQVEADTYGSVVVPKPPTATHGWWHPYSKVYEFVIGVAYSQST